MIGMGYMETRIAQTPRDQLKWALAMAYRDQPLTENDRLKLQSEAALFAGFETYEFPAESDNYFQTMAADFRRTIESAIQHKEIVGIPRPRESTLVWDHRTRRYKKIENKADDTFETCAFRRLGELILTHGHLVKRCDAPAKMKPGRKPKNGRNEAARGKCDTPFVAIKETQLYCSPACLDRALTHRNPPKKNKPKKKPKRKAK
jgi:hypothetical protein